MPCGLATGDASGTVGRPPASEKRMVTGIFPLAKIGDTVHFAASAAGAKLPSTTIPFAWFARKPGCAP